MASKELTDYVNGLGKYIRDKNTEIDLSVIDALYQASLVSMFNENDVEYALKCTDKAKQLLSQYVQREKGCGIWAIENYCAENKERCAEVDLYYNILKEESFYNLQSFNYYMEKNRNPSKRFYFPRRKTLKTVVDDLMDLENDKFDFYGLSMPARTGKSTVVIFFLTWVFLRKPNSHNAMGGHSGILAKGFYKEVLNLLTSQDYTFAELYELWNPNKTLLQNKSAEDLSLNLCDPDRFSTFTARGIDGTWTGAIDISKDGYLYVDDLIRDREHSLSPQRMENTYQEYLNKMVDRKNDGAKELMVGTLWNVLDPLERMRNTFEGDERYKFRRIPAINEDGASNFQYDINGFSTKWYLDLKAKLDAAEWEAKYQQRPFVREGLLFPKEELRYFDGILPDEQRRVVAVCDPAFGGGDSLSMPVCADFGDKQKYIIDWVFNTGTQKVTVPKIVDKIAQHGISELQIEKNAGGLLLADSIKAEMDKRQVYCCRITLVSANVKMSKEDKISGYSDYVKDNFIFLLPRSKKDATDIGRYIRSKEYEKALEEMSMFSPQGKNPHDDAPDSIVQLAQFFEKKRNGEVSVSRNPFRGMGVF